MQRVLLMVAILGGGCGTTAATGDGGGGSGGDGGSVQPTTKSGGVTVQSYTATQATTGTALAAGDLSAEFEAASACPTTTIGPCVLSSCGIPTATAESAGTITVTGALVPASISPAADKTYTALMTQPLFSGGETLTVTAAGADVPAFTHTLVAPAKITITSPAKPASASPYLMIDRSAGFSVAWTGGGASTVQIALLGGTGSNLDLSCHFPASAGSATIPASALAMLPAGTGGFAMAAIATDSLVAGDYAISLFGYYNGVWTDDSIVSGPTMVQ
jgi:hypothetical protein